MAQSRQLESIRRGPARWRSVLTTTRFDAAYGLALFLALETCGTIALGGIPEGSATERFIGWSAFAAIMIAPFVLWATRKTSLARYVQDVFIVFAIAAVAAAIILSW